MNRPALTSPARAISSLRSGSPSTAAMASAIATASSGSTSTAASPPTSGREDAVVVTTGVPHCMASSTGSPKPS